MNKKILELLKVYQEEATEFRHPEVTSKEFETSKLLKEEARKSGL